MVLSFTLYKLEKYKLIPKDVENAINAQNSQASAGRLGAMPTLDNQHLIVTGKQIGRAHV